MTLPAHLLLAIALVSSASALADGATDFPAPDAPVVEAPAGAELGENITDENCAELIPEATLAELLTVATEVVVEAEPEHTIDWCPPCGRG